MQKHVEAERGKTKIEDISRLLQDIAAQTNVAGISFTEYMPVGCTEFKKNAG